MIDYSEDFQWCFLFIHNSKFRNNKEKKMICEMELMSVPIYDFSFPINDCWHLSDFQWIFLARFYTLFCVDPSSPILDGKWVTSRISTMTRQFSVSLQNMVCYTEIPYGWVAVIYFRKLLSTQKECSDELEHSSV